MSKKAMKLALELLKSAHVSTDLIWKRHDCVQALEESLAKQEQGEPVAVRQSNGEIYVLGSALVPIGAYLYTAPQQQKPLTDEQLKPHIQLAMKYYGYDETKYGLTTTSGFVWLARAIEAAHGIKE